jgi:hypothetical protein
MPVMIPLYPSSFNARPPTKTTRRRNNPRVVSVPEKATPVVRLIFSEIARQMQTLDAMESSGVRRASIKSWKGKNRPGLESAQAVLAFLGWDFVPVPCLEALPAELAADLVALARRAETTVPHVWREALNVAVEQRVLGMEMAERRAIIERHHARVSNGHEGCKTKRGPKPTVQ